MRPAPESRLEPPAELAGRPSRRSLRHSLPLIPRNKLTDTNTETSEPPHRVTSEGRDPKPGPASAELTGNPGNGSQPENGSKIE